MRPDAAPVRSARGLRFSRLILIAAASLSLLSIAPLVLSTTALFVAAFAGCELGAGPDGGCHWRGLDLKPFFIKTVSTLEWSDPAWMCASLAVVLWMIIFIYGLVRDIRFLRHPALPGATSRLRRMYLLIPLAGATLIGFAPIAAVVWAMVFAQAFGCQANEGTISPCIVDGTDYGSALGGSVVIGWFMFLVWPFALIAIAGWVVAIGYLLSFWARSASRSG